MLLKRSSVGRLPRPLKVIWSNLLTITSVSDEPVHAIVERDDIRVMFRRASDEQPAITEAWAELEQAVRSLRGRKFYGVFDSNSREYRACIEVNDRDEPSDLKLELGTLAGGVCPPTTAWRAARRIRVDRASDGKPRAAA